jgi:hypothetical protein
MIIPRHHLLVLGLEPPNAPNIFCFAIFGIIRLRKGLTNILEAIGLAGTPQYDNSLTLLEDLWSKN